MSSTPETQSSRISLKTYSLASFSVSDARLSPHEVRCDGQAKRFGGTTLCDQLVAVGEMVSCARCKGKHSVADILVAAADGDIVTFDRLMMRKRTAVIVQRALRAAGHTAKFLGREAPISMPEWIVQRLWYIYDYGFVPVYIPSYAEWVLAEIGIVNNREVSQINRDLGFLKSERLIVKTEVADFIERATKAICYTDAKVTIARNDEYWRQVKLAVYTFRRGCETVSREWMEYLIRCPAEWIPSYSLGEDYAIIQGGVNLGYPQKESSAGITVLINPPQEKKK